VDAAIAKLEGQERALRDRERTAELTIARDRELDQREARLDDRDRQLTQAEEELVEWRRRIRAAEVRLHADIVE
jgi:hypothetical protein